jgi:MFS family permease
LRGAGNVFVGEGFPQHCRKKRGIMGVRFRLCVMMFLQYAIWGAWSPVLSDYLLNELGFSGTQVGIIYSLLPLATIVAPFIGGQIADRYFASQKVIAILQLIGGGLLLFISKVSDYNTMMWLMLFYCLLYAPTLALTNSVAFINLKNSEKEFGIVRVWGTIGWIVSGLALMGWRHFAQAEEALVLRGDTFLLAGVFSIIMGFQAFGLPRTPPKKEETKPWAFLEAIKMMKNKNFLAFVIISFIVATELMFYYVKHPRPRSVSLAHSVYHLCHWPTILASDRFVEPPWFLFCFFLCGCFYLCGHDRSEGYSALSTEFHHADHLWHRELHREPFCRMDPGSFHNRCRHELDPRFCRALFLDCSVCCRVSAVCEG